MAKKKRAKKPAAHDFMPDWLSWAADHPLLNITEGEETDEELAIPYRKAPSQLAQNTFEHYRGDPALVERLLFRVAKYHADHIKKRDASVATEEDEDIASLEEVMKAAMEGVE